MAYRFSGPVGRLSGVGIDTNNDGTADGEYSASYAYDSDNGRLNRVTGPGLPAYGVVYGYKADTNLVEKTDYRTSSAESSTIARATRSFEDHRDLITAVQNDWLVGGTTTVSKYRYGSDNLGRRTEVKRNGTAFAGDDHSSPANKDVWGYNDRNELTASTRYNDTNMDGTTDTHDPDGDHGYVYDPIGNRKTYTYTPAGESSPRTATYQRNALNQYGQASVSGGDYIANRLVYDKDGNLSGSLLVADMNCDGSINPFDINAFLTAMEGQSGYELAYPGCDWHNADIDGNGSVNPFDINGFISIMAHETGEDGPAPDTVGVLHRRFTWDAENRLIGDEPAVPPVEGDTKSAYAYDYVNRRVEKKVWTRDSGGEWDLTLHRRFVYDGWNLLMELDAADGNAVLQRYTWGLDLAGQNGSLNSVHAAGGIGGLLATRDVSPGTDYAYLYDANGNVGQAVNLSDGTIAAKYEYDPYGKRTNQPQTGEIEQPFRFSTNSLDAETAFINGKRRVYMPLMGRWAGHDPIAEGSDVNLYRFVRNQPVSQIDPLGLYGKDVHKTLTDFLANAAGFNGTVCKLTASNIAQQDQAVDEDERGPLSGFFSNDARADYHFPSQARVDALWRQAKKSCSERDIGTFLHVFQDSFAHAGWDPSWGHWYDTEVDDTSRRPDVATMVAMLTYQRLHELAKLCCCCAIGNVRDWDDIESAVRSYVSEKDKKKKPGILVTAVQSW